MPRLIDADKTYKVLTEYYHHKTDIQHDALKEALGKVPTVDAEPVRHGHWTLSTFGGNWTCSKCGCKPYHSNMENMNYCPKCGAKMDEVRDE